LAKLGDLSINPLLLGLEALNRSINDFAAQFLYRHVLFLY
jgi:hypothetical protein